MSETKSVELVVLSNVDAYSIKYNDSSFLDPVLDPAETTKDDLDQFNHPRQRRAIILGAIRNKKERYNNSDYLSIRIETVTPSSLLENGHTTNIMDVYKNVHSPNLISFLVTAWTRWVDLGERRDPSGCHAVGTTNTHDDSQVPALIPLCFPFPRDPHQIPSDNVMGQVAYYNTDTVTPIFQDLKDELLGDGSLVFQSVEYVIDAGAVAYIIPTHPGHHAARDCFGGYCYFNHAAACADLLRTKLVNTKLSPKVAILDIDYHCGNGTASIFYDDPNILVVSIHCDPNFEYPFHTGHADQVGVKDGVGTTLHIPLQPGTTWNENYKDALLNGLARIKKFKTDALIVSMGLDTYDKDPCALRRAGFCLKDNDYVQIGKTIGEALPQLPTIFIQEGGYRMEVVGVAATDVVTSFCEARNQVRI
jgi:acetoin utilization deacetylase AcuC-like enzyme